MGLTTCSMRPLSYVCNIASSDLNPSHITTGLTRKASCNRAMALPLRAMLYVRKQTMATIPKWRGWRFATKLQLAARLLEWIVPILKKAGKTVWVVVDGGYTKRPFLKRALALSKVVVVGRLRKDAALRDLPPKLPPPV